MLQRPILKHQIFLYNLALLLLELLLEFKDGFVNFNWHSYGSLKLF
jgi:hypothetical protein